MYQVKFYTGNYEDRQAAANEDRCIAYVEHHFNGSTNPSANGTLVVVGSNASALSQTWGRWYAQQINQEFGVPMHGDQGIVIGGYNGRGDGNIKHTQMPALLLEPLFASNPQHAEWIRSEVGQDKLATILCNSIVHFFPAGGLVAFSVGHKYKPNKPADRGVNVYGGGTEADYAEIVLQKAQRQLESRVSAP
jgi:N-acetylmuramoyl-L-alanine amidase